MQPTAYPSGTMINTMPGTMINTMPGTMVNMPGTMVNTMQGGMVNMPGGMVNTMQGGMVNMPGGMYPTVNQIMYNPSMVSPGMGMVYQNGFMTNMYPTSQVYVNPTMSNPNVPIQNISNANVNITSVSSPNVPISNLNNNEGNTNSGAAPPSLLSRDTQLIGEVVESNDKGIINVYFDASTGSKAVINIPENTPIKEALDKYCEKVQLNKMYVEKKKILFIFLGAQIDPESTESIKSLKIINNSKINVFDQGNVLGA